MTPLSYTRFLAFLAVSVFLTAAPGPMAHAQAAPAAPRAELTGSFTGFKLKPIAGNMLKIAGKITIVNPGAVEAEDVQAKVYLSDDRILDPEDLVYTIRLADHHGGVGTLEPKGRVTISLHQKITAFVGTLLKDQYLLIQLVAKNGAPATADNHDVVVVGPISAP